VAKPIFIVEGEIDALSIIETGNKAAEELAEGLKTLNIAFYRQNR